MYYPLFKYLADNHNLILLESEMHDLIDFILDHYPEGNHGVQSVSVDEIYYDDPVEGILKDEV